jgi:hypothetical protein
MTVSAIECDVLVIGAGAGGPGDGDRCKVARARRHPGRKRAAVWRHHGLVRRVALDPRQCARQESGASRTISNLPRLTCGARSAKAWTMQRLMHTCSTARGWWTSFTSAPRSNSSPALPFPTSHPEAPGGAVGRLVGAAPYDGRALGDLLQKLRPPLREMTVSGMAVAGGADLKQLMDASRSPAAAWYALRRFASLLLATGRAMARPRGSSTAMRSLAVSVVPQRMPGCA